MIEAYAVGARALGVLASAYLVGIPLFLLLAGQPPPAVRAWERALLRRLPFAALLLAVALAAALHAQACAVADGMASLALSAELARHTGSGRLTSLRIGLALLALAPALAAALLPRARVMRLLAVLLLAMGTTALSPLSGHAAGTEAPTRLVGLHMLHLLALGAWLGGLPAWITLARAAAHHADATTRDFAARAVQRYSRLALLCMLAIIASGVLLALAFVADQGDLLGTAYGLLLCAKLVLLGCVLAIAHTLRKRFLPSLHRCAMAAPWPDAARRVARELGLALLILGLGAALAQTPPAIHAQPHWWLPFRLSFEAGWQDPQARLAMLLGAAVLAFALPLSVLARSRRWRTGALPGAFAGLAGVAWGLAVPAWPESFLRAPVPYLTLSIEQGRQAFEAHCTGCHGSGGLGDGPLAVSLDKPPANLSEPHTALHAAGDLYSWLTHGMPGGPMPGFAGRLDEERRWDLVNFLRVFSQGFQARVLAPRIVPGRPWLGAPNFYYRTAAGAHAELKDLRGKCAVLLVFTMPRDARSLARLARLHDEAGDTLVVLAPQGDDVWQAYQFLTRTLTDRGVPDRLGMPRRHAEFLVDRFGYIRARWIPAEAPASWAAPLDVISEVARLASEPQILPPPDLHLH